MDDPDLYILVRHGKHTWTTMVPEIVIPSSRAVDKGC